MLDFIVDNRWLLFVIAEFVFWITILTAITLKYWFGQSKAAFSMFLLTVANELWILFLGIADIQRTNQLSGFQIIVIIALLYTLFFGKHHMKKTDRILSRIVARLKREPAQATALHVKYGNEKAIDEIKLFGLHVLLFITAHAIFYLFVYIGNRTAYPIPSGHWLDWMIEQFQRNESLVQMNKVWSAVLLLDALISFSYLVFPKKPEDKKDASQ